MFHRTRSADASVSSPLATDDRQTRETILRCEGVSLSFGGIHALVDVSFEVPRGSVTAMIRPNGAGKTSLLNCVSGYYRPDSGRILFDDADITTRSTWSLAAQGIARTFQHSELQLGDTVVSNIMVGRHSSAGYGAVAAALRTPRVIRQEREIRDRASDLAAFVGLGHVVNRPAGELSYGHQKLVELARALATDPKLLLLDEPTAGMHDKEKERVAEVIVRICNELEISQVLIEHDVKFVRSTCDHAVALDFGRLLTSGTPAAVLQDPAVIASYLGG